MRKLKWLIAAILTLLVVIFSVQNAATVDLQLLTWTVQIRRSAVVAGCVGIGLIIGWMFGRSAHHR